MKVRLRQNIFDRWIILAPDGEDMAWSGSSWVPICEHGLPSGSVQVSNLPNKEEAIIYASQFGFEVEA
jgi:hypothetical protein